MPIPSKMQSSYGFSKSISNREEYLWHEFCQGVLITLSDSFKFNLTSKEEIFKILRKIDNEKACGFDEIPCRMLKDGAAILAEPASQNQTCN